MPLWLRVHARLTLAQSAGHVRVCRLYADTGFSEHPTGVNFGISAILPDERSAAERCTVHDMWYPGWCTGVGWYPGWWGMGVVRTWHGTRGTGPGMGPGAVFGCFATIWPCLAVFWLFCHYLAVFGCILAVFPGIWPYLAQFGCISRYLALFGPIWPLLGPIWPLLGPIGHC